MESAQRFPRLRKWGGRVWTALLLLMLISLAGMFYSENIMSYRQFPAVYALINIPIVIVVFLVTRGLNSMHPIFTWQPSHLLFGRPRDGNARSLILAAMRSRYVGLIIALLLVFNLPIIAMLEEFIFRNGTTSWTDAALRSALFGAAHLTANVPVGACIAIGGSGMWFSYWYFQGLNDAAVGAGTEAGIMLSSTVHFAYIAVIVGLAIPAMIAQRFIKVK